MGKQIIYVSLFIIFVIAAVSEVASEEVYTWPLRLPRELSSSFAEYRSGRFHAGIDLRTGGVIGAAVLAVDDGYVSRVRCSPWGYGKAIYVQLRDGNSVVYGHLDDYYDELRDYVRANQHAAKSYIVDLYPEAGRFPVTRGQQIAVSGRTGVGPPHLHYELRDGAGRPFNPRQIGIQWPDTTRPNIRGLVAMPDGPEGTVNGGHVPVQVEITALGNGRYRSTPVIASGRIGFGVDVIDPGNDGLRLGVHVLRLLHGESEIFCVRHDQLSYDNMNNGAVSYHPFLLEKGRFLLLWRWPGNVSALYAGSPGDGWFETPDHPVDLRIEAIDFMGNTAELIVPIVPAPPRSPASLSGTSPSRESGPGKTSLACHGVYLTAEITFGGVESLAPELLVESGLAIHALPFTPVAETRWQAAFAPSQTGAYTLRVHHPNASPFEQRVHAVRRGTAAQTLRFEELTVTVKPDSPYGTLFIRATPESTPGSGALRLLGQAWRLWPDDMPIDAPVDISLPITDGAEKPGRVHLYRYSGNRWRYVGGRVNDGRVSASSRSFGLYAALEDTVPPVIERISPDDHYQAQTRRPILRATIADVGSGVSTFSITANGRWLLAELDSDENRLEWERDHDLPSGEQEIIFRVTDNAGNTSTTRRVVHIP